MNGDFLFLLQCPRSTVGVDRARWLAQSSKLLWGVTSLPGGFDSHAPSFKSLRDHVQSLAVITSRAMRSTSSNVSCSGDTPKKYNAFVCC